MGGGNSSLERSLIRLSLTPREQRLQNNPGDLFVISQQKGNGEKKKQQQEPNWTESSHLLVA